MFSKKDEDIKIHIGEPTNSQDNPNVYCISKIVGNVRYAINGWQKQSINQLIKCTEIQEEPIREMMEVFGKSGGV